MRIEAVGATDVGQKRDHNEDAICVRADLGLFVVCDGMGGMAAGEVASQLSIRTVEQHIEDALSQLPEDLTPGDRKSELVSELVEAVQRACHAVYDRAQNDLDCRGMGCTLTAVLLDGVGHGLMAHVGDSRLYVCREGTVHQLSEDHTYAVEMVKRGILDPADADFSPMAHQLTRAIGLQRTLPVDTLAFEILPGDRYLLCSDGVTKYLNEAAELAEHLDGEQMGEIPGTLIRIANERGGSDNISAVVLGAVAEEVEEEDQGQEVKRRLETLGLVSMFRFLSMKELVQIRDRFHLLSADAGMELIGQGDAGDRMYVVLEGEFSVQRDGTEIARLGSGTHFGEMSLLNSRPRSATVVALTDARLLELSRADFKELILHDQTLGLKLLWALSQVLCHRLDKSNALSVEEEAMLERDTLFPFKVPKHLKEEEG